MKLNPDIVLKILRHCSRGYTSITSLVGKGIKAPTLYRYVETLIDQGWLETEGKERYRTTQQGLIHLETAKGETPSGLTPFYPPLALVPTPQHRAMIELNAAAVQARKHELRMDRHPTLVVVGGTLRWKTSMGIFTCHMLGLDPGKQIINLAAEAGRSLLVRRTSTGKIVYKRELLDSQFVVFDEYQAADSDSRRLLAIWMDGRKRMAFENEQLTIQPVALITLNPFKGKTLEERLGISTPQIRRCIICDLSNIKMPDLAVKGEEIVKAAETHGPLILPQPRDNCVKYKQAINELFSLTLTEEGRELVDLETVVMLGSALTGFLEPLEAIRLILYDLLLVYETLGWTMPGWQVYLGSFPTTRGSLRVNPPPDREEISDEDWVRALEHLEDGGTITELVTKLHFTVDISERIAKKYAELKSFDGRTHSRSSGSEEKDEEELKLERDVRMAELQRKRADHLRPLEADKMLADLGTALDESGSWKKGHCSHISNNYCTYWGWDQRPNRTEELLKDGKWFIVPTTPRCSVCSGYHEKDTGTIQGLELQLSTIRGSIKDMWENAVKPTDVAFTAIGEHNRQDCTRLENNYCMNWWWNARPDHAVIVGEPYYKDGHWYIQPTKHYCALCSDYQKRAHN